MDTNSIIDTGLSFWLVIKLISFCWLLYALPVSLIAVPTWCFGHRRVRWQWTDFALLILPYLAWVLRVTFIEGDIQLTDVVEKPLKLGGFVGMIPLIRLIVRDRLNEQHFSRGLLLCAIAISILV